MMIGELTERERVILDRLSSDSAVSVGVLAKELELSEVTIRGILRSLEDKGWISRRRGVAAAAVHRNIMERQRIFPERKNVIAKVAADMITDGDLVMIEAGTTTALIIRYLAGKKDVHIVTNSTLALSYARVHPNLEITMTGGEFRRSTESLVGPIALDTISRLNVRLAFVGTDGFSLEHGLTTHHIEGSEIVKAMKAHAKTTILVADSFKYGKAGFADVLPLSAVDLIITDNHLEETVEIQLCEAGIKVVKGE
jgi:DeoR family galactitol utilization operon repressor